MELLNTFFQSPLGILVEIILLIGIVYYFYKESRKPGASMKSTFVTGGKPLTLLLALVGVVILVVLFQSFF